MSEINETAVKRRKKEESRALDPPAASGQESAQALEQVASQRPGAYENTHGGTQEELLGKLLDREAFHYDPESDPLFGLYREQYMRQGREAMADTMGQAAGLTGGYGSSYSRSAGSAAYSGYLDKLSEMVPRLYAQALELYEQEGQALLERYGLVSKLEQRDYDRYSDDYDRWLKEYGLASDRYDSDRKLEYQQYLDSLNAMLRQEERDRDQARWREEMDLDWEKFLWQKARDTSGRGNGG